MIRFFFGFIVPEVWTEMSIIFCTIFYLLLILQCSFEKFVTDQHFSGSNIHNIRIYIFSDVFQCDGSEAVMLQTIAQFCHN